MYSAADADVVRLADEFGYELVLDHGTESYLLADLLALDPGEATFKPKAKVLQEQTEHHHKEEENHLFPQVQKLMDPAELDTLGEEMLALQQQLRAEGEPREAVADETDAAAPLH